MAQRAGAAVVGVRHQDGLEFGRADIGAVERGPWQAALVGEQRRHEDGGAVKQRGVDGGQAAAGGAAIVLKGAEPGIAPEDAGTGRDDVAVGFADQVVALQGQGASVFDAAEDVIAVGPYEGGPIIRDDGIGEGEAAIDNADATSGVHRRIGIGCVGAAVRVEVFAGVAGDGGVDEGGITPIQKDASTAGEEGFHTVAVDGGVAQGEGGTVLIGNAQDEDATAVGRRVALDEAFLEREGGVLGVDPATPAGAVGAADLAAREGDAPEGNGAAATAAVNADGAAVERRGDGDATRESRGVERDVLGDEQLRGLKLNGLPGHAGAEADRGSGCRIIEDGPQRACRSITVVGDKLPLGDGGKKDAGEKRSEEADGERMLFQGRRRLKMVCEVRLFSIASGRTAMQPKPASWQEKIRPGGGKTWHETQSKELNKNRHRK